MVRGEGKTLGRGKKNKYGDEEPPSREQFNRGKLIK